MKTQKIILTVTLFIFSCNVSFSQISDNFKKIELTDKIINQNSIENLTKKVNTSEQSKAGEKSPYLGALFSGLIPGTGEVYSKQYIKGAVFFAIEVGLWIAYSSYESKGNDQTAAYENFADQNWNVYQYAEWLKTAGGGFPLSGDIDLTASPDVLLVQINKCEDASGFSHRLPYYGEQQYYELIGKYQTFVAGWKDANLTYLNQNQTNFRTYKSDMFINYSVDRQEANSYYDKSSTALTLVIVNHILSAADAAWSVTMFNKELKVKTGLNMENKYSYFGEKKLIPVANLNVTF